MDDARRKFLAAFMASGVGWAAATSLDDSMRDSKDWKKAKEIYKTYMELYVANMPEMSADPDSIHMQTVSAHAVALASVLAKL
jgi:hypothetical protein